MTPDAHAAFTAALVATLTAGPDVVGVVLLGSSSGLPPGPDPFSDARAAVERVLAGTPTTTT